MLPMAASSGAADVQPDEEEELQARVRVLEQRELSQMRQSAILQRKRDALEQELKLLQQQKQQRLHRMGFEAQSPGGVARSEESAQQLEEEELQRRLTTAEQRVTALEREVRSSRARRRQLEFDLAFWRCCGQELQQAPSNLADRSGGPSLEESSTEASHLRAEAAQMRAWTEELRRSCSELEARLLEVTQVTASTRQQEQELRARTEALETSLDVAKKASSQARATVAALRKEEEEELRLSAELEAQLVRSRSSEPAGGAYAASGSSGPTAGLDQDGEEVAYLRQKVQEREKEVAALRLGNSRLQASLHHHAGIEAGYRSDPAEGELNEVRCFRPLDDMTSWVATMLFKSVVVRRIFSVHLALLYTWLAFLLWWMSTQ